LVFLSAVVAAWSVELVLEAVDGAFDVSAMGSAELDGVELAPWSLLELAGLEALASAAEPDGATDVDVDVAAPWSVGLAEVVAVDCARAGTAASSAAATTPAERILRVIWSLPCGPTRAEPV
jgi:hypothetical protein